MTTRQRGYALTDTLLAVALFMLIGVVGFSATKNLLNRQLKTIELNNYSEEVFLAMTHAYMDHFANSRCLETPAEVTVQNLVDSGYLESKYIENSWYEASGATIEYVDNPNSVLPKEFSITIKVPEDTGHFMGAKYASGYTADNFLILKKVPDIKISIRMMTNMDSTGCAL